MLDQEMDTTMAPWASNKLTHELPSSMIIMHPWMHVSRSASNFLLLKMSIFVDNIFCSEEKSESIDNLNLKYYTNGKKK